MGDQARISDYTRQQGTQPVHEITDDSPDRGPTPAPAGDPGGTPVQPSSPQNPLDIVYDAAKFLVGGGRNKPRTLRR